MAGEPRKLPVLYLIPDSLDSGEQDTVAYFERSVAVALAMARCCVVAYEPAVPRCKTCEHYSLEFHECCHLLNEHEGSLEMPPDGYCSEHREAKRG